MVVPVVQNLVLQYCSTGTDNMRTYVRPSYEYRYMVLVPVPKRMPAHWVYSFILDSRLQTRTAHCTYHPKRRAIMLYVYLYCTRGEHWIAFSRSISSDFKNARWDRVLLQEIIRRSFLIFYLLLESGDDDLHWNENCLRRKVACCAPLNSSRCSPRQRIHTQVWCELRDERVTSWKNEAKDNKECLFR